MQSTFYQPPALNVVERWRRDVPEDFRFAMKAWQLITHPASSPTYRKLKTPIPEGRKGAVGGFQLTEEVWRAWEVTQQIAHVLSAAVIVFQCPASFRPTTTTFGISKRSSAAWAHARIYWRGSRVGTGQKTWFVIFAHDLA